jgi:hypothetical protein
VIKLTTFDGLLVSFDAARFAGIPHEIKESLALWVVHALRPGSCVVALLEHDLARADQHAHPTTRPHLPAIVEWIATYVPAEAKGQRGLKLWQGYSRW